MIVNVKTHELSPDITAMSFTGRLIRGHRWNDIEHVIRERVEQGVRKLVLDFSGLEYIDSSGIGFIAVQSIGQRDYPVIQGTTVILAVAVVLMNLVTDIAYTFLDPRIRAKS